MNSSQQQIDIDWTGIALHIVADDPIRTALAIVAGLFFYLWVIKCRENTSLQKEIKDNTHRIIQEKNRLQDLIINQRINQRINQE